MNAHSIGGPQAASGTLPRRIEGEIRFRLGLLRPHRRQIGVVLALNGLVLLVTGVLYAVFGIRSAAGERGLFSTADSLQLLVAGVLGVLVFVAALRSRVSGALHHNLPWGVIGLGLVLLAVDDYATVHERGGRWITEQLDLLVPYVGHPDDLLTLTYGVVGLTLLWLFRRDLRLRAASSTLLGAGVAAAALMLALDAAAGRGLQVLENPVQLLASALLMLAMLARWQEVARIVTPRPAPDARTAEPAA